MKFLKNIWKKWIRASRVIGNFQAQVLFTIFYFVILAPVGVIFRLSQDPLSIKITGKTAFSYWNHDEDNPVQAKKQY